MEKTTALPPICPYCRKRVKRGGRIYQSMTFHRKCATRFQATQASLKPRRRIKHRKQKR